MRDLLRFLALVVLLFLGACDSPIAPGDDAVGVVFLDGSGGEVARFMEGTPPSVSGGLTVGVGETTVYRVGVVTRTGALVDLDGAAYELRDAGVVIGRSADARVRSGGRIAITGRNPGRTSIFVYLHHFGDLVFLVKDVPLTVR